MIREQIFELYPDEDFLFLSSDFDSAIIGIVEGKGIELKVCYSKNEILRILEKEMDEEKALEYFSDTVIDHYVGPKTPVFMALPENKNYNIEDRRSGYYSC